MSTSSTASQSVYSPSDPETPQGTTKLQNFDTSVNHADLGQRIEQSMKNAQKEMHQKRIQELRKELDYLKATEWEFDLVEYVFPKKTEEDDDESKEDFLAEQLLDLEICNENNEVECNNEVAAPAIPRNAECFQRAGLITYACDEYVLIDGMHYFDMSACSIKVQLNDKVLYLCYKEGNDSIVVVRILENQGIYWGEDEIDEENAFNVIEHTVLGEVESRQDRFVYMKGTDLKFSLDDVEATFVPIQGDWLELNCTVQFDENKPADISGAQVLQVISYKPLRSKVKSAVVTDWSGTSGTCDRLIYFDKHSLQNGCEPQVGSKVIVEAIESNQGTCTWRVLKLILTDNQIMDNKENIQQPIKEDASLDVEKDRDIDFTYPIKFERVDFQQTSKMNINITNNSDEVYVMNKWMVLSKKRDSQVDIKPFISRPVKIYPKQTFTMTVTCYPKFLGNSKECFIIMFKGFQLKRFIEVNVIDNSTDNGRNYDGNGLKSEKEKIDMMRNIRNAGKKPIVQGVRPVKPPAFVPVRLGGFPIPDKLWSAVLGDSDQTIYMSDYDKILERIETKLPCLTQDLNITNYVDKWHTLMYMEEIQANICMRSHDTPKAFLIRCQEYLGIEINGLAERRPSLIKGDKVIVKDVWDSNAVEYEGFIHVIKGNLVLMKFNAQFHETYNGSDVSLEFHFNRSTYRRSHQAINLALSHLGSDILFPTRVVTKTPQLETDKLKEMKWFNENLNDGQKTAVRNILRGECRPLPYCIYGPPGTGKTVTVVETILQILTHLPDSRILVATPSNSAANLLTERLVQYRKGFSDSVIRLIANYLLDTDNIPDVIKPYCATMDIAREETSKPKHFTKDDGINLNCQTSFIGRHRVTIGTCYCLGTLAQMGLPRGHFTHIVVDEAGQATEPEIMIPLTFIDKESGQIILAGDPMQLGPVVMSKYSKEYGLEESYLSRLLETFPYQRDYAAYENGFNNKLVTKLNDNYRSLVEVLKLPSEMFYDGTLVAKIDRNEEWIPEMTEVVSKIFDASDPSTGGIFVYGIRGCNARAEDSPSWYNPQEASMVMLTVCKLFKKGISEDDIGVITPYIAQIKYLRVLFEAMGIPQPKIGTVEEFQGQERPIILISTVRSSETYLQEDNKHTLGFVKSPKRLNVAITRARVACLLFCNPHLLSTDPLWKKVIAYAVKDDKYMGCDLPQCFV